ncbi:MAG TPA: polysaccharide deacetylase family protein [Candidatus Saccharimonadales bacterium]|nr:polysaccharide deacetylase family protein [Candidatus Saccharimonadales bacterium]
MAKKILVGIAVALIGLIAAFFVTQSTHAPGVNLITNPSFEERAGDQPKDWQQNAWGANSPSFAYVTNEGRTGTHSARVTLADYKDGDGKWFAKSVVLQAGKRYAYSDYYKSDVATELLVQFQDASGQTSYFKLADVPAAAKWKQVEATFVAPANLKGATVLHLLKATGTLQIDDAYLGATKQVVTPNEPHVNANLVINTSAEITAAGQPKDWYGSGWGEHTRTHTFAAEGRTGNRSLKTEVKDFAGGSAQWEFAPQNVTPGQVYQYGDYYKADAPTEINIVYYMADGGTKHQYLGTAQPSSDWLHFWHTFTVPEGATKATVQHLLHSNGTLSIDDVTFGPFREVGFDRAIISLTFDDAWRSIHANAFPILKKYGLTSTQYLLSGKSNEPEYMTTDMMKEFKNSGHEIAAHTIDHADLTKIDTTNLRRQLVESKSWFTNAVGVTPVNFATPYGAYNSDVIGFVKQNYRSHRSVETGYNGKDNFDIYNIRVQNITNQTTPAEVASWIAKAESDRTWLVIVYHQVDENPGEFGTTPKNFDSQMATLKAMNLPVLTVNAALDEIAKQLK